MQVMEHIFATLYDCVCVLNCFDSLLKRKLFLSKNIEIRV